MRRNYPIPYYINIKEKAKEIKLHSFHTSKHAAAAGTNNY